MWFWGGCFGGLRFFNKKSILEKHNGFAVNINERSFCRAERGGREHMVVLMLLMERRGLMKED